jgi:hypothetical protein
VPCPETDRFSVIGVADETTRGRPGSKESNPRPNARRLSVGFSTGTSESFSAIVILTLSAFDFFPIVD